MKKLDLTGLGDLVASSTHVAADGGIYGDHPLQHIRISRTNRKRFNADALAKLANNIAEVGIIQPILIRRVTPTASEPQVYEIVAGERRYRAATIAGLVTIPAVCRALTDNQAREIQLLENLQREDPHPMEEAEGFQELMLTGGYNADQLADKLKKSRSYIYGRLKLCALAANVRELFLDDKFPASVALLIARIPAPTLQARAAGEILNPPEWKSAEPLSYRQALEHIRRNYTLDLNSAVFSIKDASLLPGAGACTACPKRSGNQPEVFADVASADVCTDPDCYSEKRAAHVARLKLDALARGMDVIDGDEAEKIMPGSYGGLKSGYVDLDAMVYLTGGKSASYRTLLGKNLPAVALLESPYAAGVTMEIAKEADLAALLKQTGLDLPESDSMRSDARKSQEKQQESAAKIERTYRRRLFLAVRDDRPECLDPWNERHVATMLMEQCPTAEVDFITSLYGLLPVDYEGRSEGGTYVGQRGKLNQWIEGLPMDRVRSLIRDLTLVDELTVHAYTGGKDVPLRLTAAAERLDVSAARIRAEVNAEAQAKLDAKAAKKKPAKATA
jgi:ParB/RepB/Spo0J family partition protein